MITVIRQLKACTKSLVNRLSIASKQHVLVGIIVSFFMTLPSWAEDVSDSYASYVEPTLSKAFVTEYIWIRNFKRFTTRDAAIKAACQFVDYNAVDHRCPVDVKLTEGKLGYGLYVHFNKKSVEWENFSSHIEKFDVVQKLEAECRQDNYQVAVDLDNDGSIDRCLPNAKISAL